MPHRLKQKREQHEHQDQGHRRTLLKTTGAGALMAAIGQQFPFGANVAQAAGPETPKANLGFIALNDAGALFVTEDEGLFAKHGMPGVEVHQAAWRDARHPLLSGAREGQWD